MNSKGHLNVTHVKIAYILLMVRDRRTISMKHYWEIDIGLSEPENKFTLDNLGVFISRLQHR